MRFDHTRLQVHLVCCLVDPQSILEAVSTKGRNIRIPGNQIAMMRKVKTATEQLEQHLERHPTEHEIATHLDVTVEAVRRTQAIDQKVSSLDKQVNDESPGDHLIEFLSDVDVPSPTASLEREDLLKEIAGALNALPARQADVLLGRLGWIVNRSRLKRLEPG